MSPLPYALTLSLAYLGFTQMLVRGLGRIGRGRSRHIPTAVVIVAAHNERGRIPSLLHALSRQTYDSTRWEIVVADDRSTDGTAEFVEAHASDLPVACRVLRVDHCPQGISPKKNAIAQSIAITQSELVVTTDADCRPEPEWLARMVAEFGPSTGIVCGFSPILGADGEQGFLRGFQWLDSLSLATTVAGLTGWNIPLTATARSFAYRRQAFEATGGFGESMRVASGDDDLLLHRILARTQWQVGYTAGSEALVPTDPAPRWRDLITARVRHASKIRHYPIRAKAIGGFLLIVNLTAAVALGATLSGNGNGAGLLFLGMKLGCDFLALNAGRRRLGAGGSLRWLPLTFIFHPFYVIGVGLAGLRARYHWKGRAYRP